jgi:threonine aldolase
MDTIDLRSDTVSHPTAAMREAMAKAAVGDDVFGDDPSVNQLQDYAADLLGKQAALFVTSGTQGNVIACLTHCQRGDELIVGKRAHVFQWEAGAASALGGISMNQVPVQPNGEMRLEDIQAAVRNTQDVHHPLTRLICLENTQGGVGGVPLTAAYSNEVANFAHANGLKLHIDGARLFNAAAALDAEPRELVRAADTVQICLSKGLCAPAGSLLLGDVEFIQRARRLRKMLGGGMRQAGVIAATGLIALRDMRKRLKQDHESAAQLAAGLAGIAGITVQPIHQPTNMVLFSIAPEIDSAALLDALRARNIVLRGGPNFRAVTHYWITPERVDYVIESMRDVIAQSEDRRPRG